MFVLLVHKEMPSGYREHVGWRESLRDSPSSVQQ